MEETCWPDEESSTSWPRSPPPPPLYNDGAYSDMTSERSGSPGFYDRYYDYDDEDFAMPPRRPPPPSRPRPRSRGDYYYPDDDQWGGGGSYGPRQPPAPRFVERSRRRGDGYGVNPSFYNEGDDSDSMSSRDASPSSHRRRRRQHKDRSLKFKVKDRSRWVLDPDESGSIEFNSGVRTQVSQSDDDSRPASVSFSYRPFAFQRFSSPRPREDSA
ncbi:uncharacterized protein LOC9643318 [Selaginella moellendorffii]|nr:uncharacterized protein LOC9643318 [Selaginella moellendorffii]|eukprot:XP_024515115.1 uncharacterized protein LOC9643318 [Selaginella moellendorffii]